VCDAHPPPGPTFYIWLHLVDLNSLTAPIDGDPGKQRKDWDRSHLRRPSGNRKVTASLRS